MDDLLVLGIIWYAVFVVSVTFHEAAHAFIAYKLGDSTAFHGGQVTLNPIPHMKREPFGMVIIPWISYAAAGWMMGWASAPYDPEWADLYPRRAAWMALSGPGANLLLAVAAGILIHIGLATGLFQIPAPGDVGFSQLATSSNFAVRFLAILASVFFSLNLVLFVFNMIPIAPLDGRAWLELLLKGNVLFLYRAIMRHPAFRIFGIFIAWMIMGLIFAPIHHAALILLYFMPYKTV